MVKNITYTKTLRGKRAFIKQLPDAVGQILTSMGEDASEGEIFKKLNDVSRHDFKEAVTWLLEGGFIKLTDADPFPKTATPVAEAIQVDEISITEFTNSSKPIHADISAAAQTKATENKAKLDALSSAVREAKKKAVEREVTKLKAEAAAKKEQERLAAIAAAKLAATAKAREAAQLLSEAEVGKAAEINAKKEEWAKLKLQAEEKERAEDMARKAAQEKRKASIQAKEKAKEKAEEKEKAKIWVQLKKEAKSRAEEKARLEKVAKAEAEIQQKRSVRNARATSWVKKWFSRFLQGIKSLFLFCATAVCILLIAAHFINISMLVTPLEKVISTHLEDDIDIESVHVWLYPKPHLLLKGLTVNNKAAIYAKKMRIYPDYSNLKAKLYDKVTTPYKLGAIMLEGLSITQADLPLINTWAKAAAKQAEYRVSNIIFKETSLQLNVVKLPPLDGEVLLSSTGLLRKASWWTAEKNFKLKASNTNGAYLIDIDVANWQSPFHPQLILNNINATGVIEHDVLKLTLISSGLYGGNLTGKFKTNLASAALATSGDFNLKELTIHNTPKDMPLSKSLAGTLNSRGYFSFSIGNTLNEIKKTKLNAAFTVESGVLKRVDIAEAMRSQNLNGATNFSKLTGNLSLSNKRYQFTNLSLQDNQLQATGQLSISAQNLVSATISSNITIRDSNINTNLVIEGPLTALKVKN